MLLFLALAAMTVIALGFVIRVAGGGIAINVPVSNWLYLCTLLLAAFGLFTTTPFAHRIDDRVRRDASGLTK